MLSCKINRTVRSEKRIGAESFKSVVLLVSAFTIWSTNAEADQQTELAKGRKLYGMHCASCHGVQLEGQPNWQQPKSDGTYPAPPHDDTGHTWHHSDRLLTTYTKLGGKEMLRRMGVADAKSGMPGFGELLNDDQILAVLDFIKSHWSERNQDHQKRVSAKDQ